MFGLETHATERKTYNFPINVQSSCSCAGLMPPFPVPRDLLEAWDATKSRSCMSKSLQTGSLQSLVIPCGVSHPSQKSSETLGQGLAYRGSCCKTLRAFPCSLTDLNLPWSANDPMLPPANFPAAYVESERTKVARIVPHLICVSNNNECLMFLRGRRKEGSEGALQIQICSTTKCSHLWVGGQLPDITQHTGRGNFGKGH